MARPIDEFTLAWKALSCSSDKDGWNSIAVSPAGSCLLRAGRRFPGNEESLLACFSTARLPPAVRLPEGRGFEVVRANPFEDGKTWIALTRKDTGSPELFAEMVGDIAGALDVLSGEGDERLLNAFLTRVRSWQEFMQKGAQALSHEDEIGLLGELTILQAALSAGVAPMLAVESWVGPLRGIQDFELGTGAIEVKATLATQGFAAKITSLEQLDDATRKPLFVAGIKFRLSDSGKTLPEFAKNLGEIFFEDADAYRIFSESVFAAGLHESHVDHYSRRFHLDEIRLVAVDENFPRLIPSSVPLGIRRAVYEIDLDRITGRRIELAEVLQKLGVL